MKFHSRPSPNFNQRRLENMPDMIIIHITGMTSAEEALSRLCDPDAQVSAHYTIDEDGAVYHHVPENMRAWHAGVSYWRGETDINSRSLGIELVNPGHEHGYRPFPPDQIDALIRLCTELIHRHPILPDGILGHADVAPERRWFDPGELFPWAKLASAGIGVWPEPDEEDIQRAGSWSLDDYVAAVHEYGYDPNVGYEAALRAFERHFAPELILGTLSDELVARSRLACLLRQI
jgi:N-acetylmuramoyl-L-alanine amidase